MSQRSALVASVATSFVLIVAAASAITDPADRPQPLALTHGIASGDVTASSVVIWGRATARAQMHADLATDVGFASVKSSRSAPVLPENDFTAQLAVRQLEPDTRYWYRVWLAGAGGKGRSDVGESQIGTFRTAPAADQSRPISFVVGADLAGQGYCRSVEQGGYRIFASMEALRPDFFVANGDMIYADHTCPADGPEGWKNIPGDFPGIGDPSVDWTNTAQVRDVFLRHYRYNRADPFYQSFLRSTPTISQWDDHEVINDFGAPWTYWNSATMDRPGYPNIVRAGLETFFAYSAIDRVAEEPERIYRSFRFGRHLELFVLDARSYRDRNDLPDTAENDKVMLGREQLAWLVEGIRGSDATWKVVSSDVPISIGTGSVAFGRDAWANIGAEPTGFERELLRLLSELDRINATNLVFVTTDVHFAQNILHDVDADADGDRLVFHELISGPLNAGRLLPRPLDPAANPTSLYAESGTFNFNFIRIVPLADGSVHLVAEVRDENGEVRPGSLLHLAAH